MSLRRSFRTADLEVWASVIGFGLRILTDREVTMSLWGGANDLFLPVDSASCRLALRQLQRAADAHSLR